MAVMIKLSIKSSPDLKFVQNLPGLRDLSLDMNFGLVLINSNRSEYVVRTDFIDNLDERKRISPEIVEAYGDIQISST